MITSTADESRLLWADMRFAGLVKSVGGGDISLQPANPFSGIAGFENGAFNNAFTTTVLCLSKVPAAAAQAIDQWLDDGVSNSGTVQSMAEPGTALIHRA